jgi:hypothetical protein
MYVALSSIDNQKEGHALFFKDLGMFHVIKGNCLHVYRFVSLSFYMLVTYIGILTSSRYCRKEQRMEKKKRKKKEQYGMGWYRLVFNQIQPNEHGSSESPVGHRA